MLAANRSRSDDVACNNLGDSLALIVGFGLSAIIQAIVSKEEMSRLLPDDSARTVAVACGLGQHHFPVVTPPSRSHAPCSAKGANFTAAMAFQFASTNLVVELGILLALLMGWQFTLAEFTSGPLGQIRNHTC